jgi:hypothetical protein
MSQVDAVQQLTGEAVVDVSRSANSFVNRTYHAEEFALLAAFNAVDTALVATMTYLRRREEGALKNDATEQQLSGFWRTAATAVSPIDPSLGDAMYRKGLGWTSPDAWELARQQGVDVGIPAMQNAQRVLMRKRNELRERMIRQLPSWFPYAGAAFCLLTVLFLMYWITFGPPLEPQKKIGFDILMAFCAAGSISYIGGEAAVRGNVPFFQSSPVQFSATAGIASLVIVFLVLHYAA